MQNHNMSPLNNYNCSAFSNNTLFTSGVSNSVKLCLEIRLYVRLREAWLLKAFQITITHTRVTWEGEQTGCTFMTTLKGQLMSVCQSCLCCCSVLEWEWQGRQCYLQRGAAEPGEWAIKVQVCFITITPLPCHIMTNQPAQSEAPAGESGKSQATAAAFLDRGGEALTWLFYALEKQKYKWLST